MVKNVVKKVVKNPAVDSQEVAAPVERPVVVTTAHRGVFFGYAKDTSGETIKLRAARNCVYWSSDVKGFIGLVASGPTRSCRSVQQPTSSCETSPVSANALPKPRKHGRKHLGRNRYAHSNGEKCQCL